jgi:hypothetical protein
MILAKHFIRSRPSQPGALRIKQLIPVLRKNKKKKEDEDGTKIRN